MLDTHRRVLEALAEGGGDFPFFGFDALAAYSDLDRAHVRRIVRHLARKGLAQFGKGLWTEEGEPAGSGYCITDAGRAVLSDLSSAKGES